MFSALILVLMEIGSYLDLASVCIDEESGVAVGAPYGFVRASGATCTMGGPPDNALGPVGILSDLGPLGGSLLSALSAQGGLTPDNGTGTGILGFLSGSTGALSTLLRSMLRQLEPGPVGGGGEMDLLLGEYGLRERAGE